MSEPIQSHSVSSGQLRIDIFDRPKYALAVYKDLKHVSEKEYLDFMYKNGEMISSGKTGRVLADFSELQNYTLGLRAIALNNLKASALDKAPYFIVAIVKSKSTFDNIAIEIAIKAAKQLSGKFLDGRMFSSRDDAMQWLCNYPVPSIFESK